MDNFNPTFTHTTDGCDVDQKGTAPVCQFKVEADYHGLSISIRPADINGLTESIAEIAVDYYNGRLRVLVWDYERLGNDPIELEIAEDFAAYCEAARGHLSC